MATQAKEAAEKAMFEVYRQAQGGAYRAIFYSDLDEHHRDKEIAHAMAGEHVLDGFVWEAQKAAAKAVIDDYVERLNRGEDRDLSDLARDLKPYMA